MADRGPLPTQLQIKKITVEIRRLEHQIEFQECEVMELQDGIIRKEENIEASKKEIEKQKALLRNIEGPGKATE